MAHIIYVNGSTTSRFNASLELNRRLKKRGHKITYLSLEKFKTKIVNASFDYVELPAPNYKDFESWNRSLSRWQKFRQRKQRRQELILKRELEAHFQSRVDRLKPDIILFDIEQYYHVMAVWSLQVPMVLVCNWFIPWRVSGLPPLNTAVVPGEGFLGSPLGLRWLWFKIWIWNQKERFRISIVTLGLEEGSVLKHWARKQTIPWGDFKVRPWLIAAVFPNLNYLSMTFKELDFPHPAPRNHGYVGPMVMKKRTDPIEDSTSAALDRLYRERADGECTALVYATFSTFFQTDTRFFAKLVDAFRERPDWHLVVGLGQSSDLKTKIDIPNNVHAYDWVPQLEVLEHADCCITHAGTGSFHECLCFGVPMLVYSGENWDQNGCAARLVYHGVAVQGDKQNDSPSEILKKLETTIKSPVIRKNLAHFRNVASQYEKEAIAERHVESLLREATCK